MRILLHLTTIAALTVALLGFGMAKYAQSEESPNASIDLEQIRKHTEFLADDALEGRESGQQGSYAAATYIVKQLEAAQVLPAGEGGSYFQPFGKGYRNILAQLPAARDEIAASDNLQTEWIVLSAHYDHVGFGSKKVSNGPIGQIHNGADDNASGVAAILEVAKQLSTAGRRRSILVVFWDAEEKGLLGSKHWLEHPTIKLNQIKLMVNVDMVGRLRDSLSLYGTRTAPGLRMAWSDANSLGVSADTSLKLNFPWQVINNSDHYEFFKRRIPITMMHTGLHDDYHRPSDDVHLLNQRGIQQTAKLLVDFIATAMNQDTIQGFRSASYLEGLNEQRYFERPFRQQQRRLGLTVKILKPTALAEPARERKAGLEIDSILVGSPAGVAGLRPGERILEANGQLMNNVVSLRKLVERARGSVVLRVQPIQGKPKNVEVQLAGKPKKIGLSWRTSDAEPGAMMISGVAQGSPADEAGLKRLDRVIRVDGEPIADSDAFRAAMLGLVGETELLVERNGRLKTILLRLDVPSSKESDELDSQSNTSQPVD